MRVLIVNTSEKTGGAAVASNRLMEALNNNGVKLKCSCVIKNEPVTVVGLKHTSGSQVELLMGTMGHIHAQPFLTQTLV